MKLTEEQIAEIQEALANDGSEESIKTLGKYDEETVAFVNQNGLGEYILIPDVDANGNVNNIKSTSNNLKEWNIPKYMVGTPDDTWMQKQLEDGAINTLALIFLFAF